MLFLETDDILLFMPLFMRYKKKVNLLVPGVHRTSRLQMFFEIVVLKNFANFTGKHLCWSRPVILLKTDSNRGIFLWNLLNFKNNFFYRTTLAITMSYVSTKHIVSVRSHSGYVYSIKTYVMKMIIKLFRRIYVIKFLKFLKFHRS